VPLEAAMIWNEPNNKSHWDPELDPDWERFSTLVTEAGKAIRSVNPGLKRVLGGMSPIDPFWVEKLKPRGVLDHVEVVAVHGFPLDWNLWPIHEWPDRIAEIEAVAPDHEIWATEVGVGSFGAEEVQVFGSRQDRGAAARARAARLLVFAVRSAAKLGSHDAPQAGGRLLLLPPLLHGPDPRGQDAQAVARAFPRPRADMGIMQWFHWHDHRLDDAVRWLKDLGVTSLRTGLSWWDSYRPGWEAWFDRRWRRSTLRHHRDLLLHARSSGPGAAPHQPAQGPDVFRRFLRADGGALRPAQRMQEPRNELADPPATKSGSPSSASAIAPARWCRASPITRMAAPTTRSA
jgi:hypothetical protein